LPIFRSDKSPDVARKLKLFLNPEDAVPRGAIPDAERHDNKVGNPKENIRQSPTSELRTVIESKKQELQRKKHQFQRVRAEQRTAEERRRIIDEHLRGIRGVEQEIFRLEREFRAAEEGWAGAEPVTGALPDFLIIGVGKGGTTFLYHLLSQHPYVEAAALKEPRFFDRLFEDGVEWYRQLFPRPRLKDGRRTITGEATPYLNHPLAPERVASVVPHARLVALLRDPVDRAYSRYHQLVRHGLETRTFEEVVEAEKAWLEARTFEEVVEEQRAWLLETSRQGYRADFDDVAFGDLYKGIYVEHLRRWSEFFSKEQMLVLKSEDFFREPVKTLKDVLDFLDLPEWEPEASQLQKKRNTREYEEMDPVTRRYLEEYFEPHNKRLYDFLGRDVGW
jgi:hypothetical protein